METTIQGFRLSAQQAHLWPLQQNGAAYRAHCAIALEGVLNDEILEQALNQIIACHQILRTTFVQPAGIRLPVQAISETEKCQWQRIDVSGQSPDQQATHIQSLFRPAPAAEAEGEEAPPLQVTLLRQSAYRHLLRITLPSLCADAWTLNNLVTELSKAYAELLLDSQSHLNDRSLDEAEVIQYAQFAEWQYSLLEEAAPPSLVPSHPSVFADLKLPGEQDIAAGAEFTPDVLTVTIPSEQVAKLDAIAPLSSTVPVWLLACWQTLLWRLTSSPTLVVDYLLDGRPYEELHNAIGLFAQALPVTGQFQSNLSFQTVLANLTAAVADLSTQLDPFLYSVMLNGESAQLSEQDAQPSSEIGFEYAVRPPKAMAGGVSFSIQQQSVYLTPYKVKLVAIRTAEALAIEFHYDTQAFEKADIQRLAGQLCTLLGSTLAQPQTAIDQLAILTPSERQQLLVEFNQTQQDYPSDRCFHTLFEQQVVKTPDAPAVVFGDQSLTYRDLDTRANQLAHQLQTLGVGPDSLVGICLAPGLEMMVGLLGILKAGGAYVPLDPAYPPSRLKFMLEDAQVAVLLTQQTLQQSLVSQLVDPATQVLCLDTASPQLGRLPQTSPASTVTSEHLAYVIYTSGSTGQPKGTLIPHRGLVNYLSWCIDAYAVAGGCGSPVHSSIGFDATLTSLFSPLLVGQPVMMLANDGERATQEIEALRDALSAHNNFSLVKITPAHLDALSQLLPPETAQGCSRALVIGGEALLGQHLTFWRKHAPRTRLINEYGPTETVVGCCVYEVPLEDTLAGEIPIGRPIANTQLYVLDQHGQPVPIGVSGELYIGGAGVARGYLNRPQLTAERFIANPFGRGRLYKTGDLARYRPDGTLEYLGRLDHQVKVRGFRIELGEIEACLSGHPAVRSARVIVRPDAQGYTSLAAYIVPEQLAPTPGDLHRFLAATLPDYMVPTAFVMLTALPLTANGKVDRAALPAPDAVSHGRDSQVAPRTPTETVLVSIWQDLLGREVGIYDNFFEVGGHSLLATQVISRLRTAFAVELPLGQLFERPTVASLSEAIEAARQEDAPLPLPAIVPRPQADDRPLSFTQQRLWFLDQLEQGKTAYNVSAAVRFDGQLDRQALSQAIAEIVNRHETLRTHFQLQAGTVVAAVSPASSVTLEAVDLQGLSEAEQAMAVQQRAEQSHQTAFDLATGPLLRLSLLQLKDTRQVLLLTMHHIISDGWSMEIMLREVAALYTAFSQGQPSPLPALPVQYADFAHWQQLTGPLLETQLNYWRQQLTDAPPVLDLPTDRPRPALQTFHGQTERFQLDSNLTQALKQLSQQTDTTLFMTLLAAFASLLSRYSTQEDILIGSPIANRHRQEIEPLIGCFLNTLVLRTDLSGNPTFTEVLNRVRQVALEAYAHQDVPFEQLVSALQPDRNLSHSPLFQVMFTLQPSPLKDWEVPGVTLTPLEIESVTAKFDLFLSLTESESGLTGIWEYNSDLFDPSTMTAMIGHFQTLLRAIASHPEQQLADLPLLSEPEQHQLMETWNSTQVVYPQRQGLHQLFEAQVQQTPEAIAVEFEAEQLTYRELNARANQLAHHLQSLGIGPESRVGLYIERSLEMMVGLLGILKAGGAYIPLDPAYPTARLEHMLTDASVSALLTQQSLVATLPSPAAQVICIDTDWPTLAQHPEHNPTSGVQPEHPAYVIYTSGSTGKPKGVQVLHRGVVNFLRAMQDELQLTPEDILLAVTTLSFDIAVLELFLPICTGARTVLASRTLASDGAQLGSALDRLGVTVMQATPATWRLLLAAGWAGQARLSILCGGEALPQALADQLRQRGHALWNLYGPTETTIWSAMHRVDQKTEETAPADHSALVSIGRPIANTQIFILDRHRQPVPIGVPSELHIGGAGLARGYLNRPDLTQEKFIPHPCSQASRERGERLYRTGDLARYRRDGTIEFLGRLDHQVKIRGHRIELGEIEALLAQHPAIAQTVVVDRPDATGQGQLVAYIVPEPTVSQQALPTTSELRRSLQQALPDYMVPAIFVTLEALPLTPNAKVDRRALPAPDGHRPSLDTAYVLPQTNLEKKITTIWQELLSVERVGIHDNFFELGGHSLLLVQLHSRLQETLEHSLSMVELFQYPTVHTLAKRLSQPAARPSQFGQDRAKTRRQSQSANDQRRQRRQAHRLANLK
ncbi:MAG: amino acid adenylation domain-containing protein [Phormidesmis sp.]